MKSLVEREETLREAWNLGMLSRVGEWLQHHEAFANSVMYLVTGWTSGGYGGPSMRELYVRQFALERGLVPGEMEILEAAKIALEAGCYGPLRLEHAKMLGDKLRSGDAPGEEEAARMLLLLHPEQELT
jgi:hypothetical protein